MWNQFQTKKHKKAFVTFDGLFSILPILMIILFTFNAAQFLTNNALERMHNQIVFDKLVSIADYTVKQGAAVTGQIGSPAGTLVRYPNYIDRNKLTTSYEDELNQRSNLQHLNIDLSSPGDGNFCIYRIVTVQDLVNPINDKYIDLLYVCGD